MYSEKLKQLIKDNVPLKFRIKDEQQSKELQEFLFALGVFWGEGDTTVCRVDHRYALLDIRPWATLYSLTTDYENNFERFKEKTHKEFDLENDCLVETETENRDKLITEIDRAIKWIENDSKGLTDKFRQLRENL